MNPSQGRIRTALRELLTNEAGGGIVLMAVAALALLTANSPLAPARSGPHFDDGDDPI